MTVSFYRQMAAALQQGAIAVATVVQSRGSVPREVGAKLFLDAQGDCVGTIGGGAGEAKVIHQAKAVCATGDSQWVELNLSGSPQHQAEGICGGVMRVWIARWQGPTARSLVQTILTQLEAGQSVTLVTPLTMGRSPYLQTSEDKSLDSETSSLTPYSLLPISPCFTEILHPPPTLLIVGAGHCGIQLAKVAGLAGFQVMVQDDRPEWATAAYYPQASRIFTGAIAEAVTQLAQQSQLYVALVTRGYQYDLDALKCLLQRQIPCQYIGMIGSQKRVQQVFQALEQAGIGSNQLRTVNAPIGLDIGALTPEEIAVSIVAELILVRRGGTGQPLSGRRRE